MLADQMLRDGDLVNALKALQSEIKANPANVPYRVFLFQLLSVVGAWDRARNQLEVAGDMDPGTLAMVQAYRETLKCELSRREVFSGGHSPLLFGQPEKWMALCVQAMSLTADSKHVEAEKLRSEAYDLAPVLSGKINDSQFEWIADADSRIGPFVEAVISGNYYWVPFCRIKKITFEQPEDLRDLVWTPAQFVLVNGGSVVGFVPTRYPDSENSSDPDIQLARKTEWIQCESSEYFGLGQRIFATDTDEFALLDIREIEFDNEVRNSFSV